MSCEQLLISLIIYTYPNALLLVAVTLLFVAMMLRSQWVCEQHCIVMDLYGPIYYEALPTCRVMFWMFWVWDIDVFLAMGWGDS